MIGGARRRSLHRVTRTPKRSRRAVLYLVASVALTGLIASLFILHAVEIHTLRRELRDLQAAQQAARIEQEVLRERLAQKDDPGAIEEEARARLGWVMPGEEKVIFIGEEGG